MWRRTSASSALVSLWRLQLSGTDDDDDELCVDRWLVRTIRDLRSKERRPPPSTLPSLRAQWLRWRRWREDSTTRRLPSTAPYTVSCRSLSAGSTRGRNLETRCSSGISNLRNPLRACSIKVTTEECHCRPFISSVVARAPNSTRTSSSRSR